LGGADLHFISPQPDTSLLCQTTDTGLVHRTVCLFTSQLSLVHIAPTHEGMARLSWPGYQLIYLFIAYRQLLVWFSWFLLLC